MTKKIRVIFEDEQLLVLDKPAGLISTESETTSQQITLSQILTDDFGINLERGGLVHRLDKDTSGIILAARNYETLQFLQDQFRNREVRKEYIALVHGFTKDHFQISGAIARNPKSPERFIVLDDFGKIAETEFQMVEKLIFKSNFLEQFLEQFSKIQIKKIHTSGYGQFSLIKAYPKTGRTHQIRVHLKYLNHSIVSDDKYGGRKTIRLDRRWCPRQFLHASVISFLHPNHKQVEFKSKVSDDLLEVLDKLSRYDRVR